MSRSLRGGRDGAHPAPGRKGSLLLEAVLLAWMAAINALYYWQVKDEVFARGAGLLAFLGFR